MDFFVIGLLLGISAGVSPGPLMAVLISETLKGNIKNGVIISIVPVLTDIPLIIILLIFLHKIEYQEMIIKVLSFCGFIVLFYYGIKDIFTSKVNLDINKSSIGSLKKGLLTNILNPHPYIFWGLIGVPFMVGGTIFQMIGFVSGFFAGIVGSKIAIALVTEKSKKFINSRYYIYLIRGSGIVLIIFGMILFLRAFGFFPAFK